MSSGKGFWNFRFKLILLIASLMAGTLLVQSAIRNYSVQMILEGTERVATRIANEAAEKVLIATSNGDPKDWNSGGGTRSYFFNTPSPQKLELNIEPITLYADEWAERVAEFKASSNSAQSLQEALLSVLIALQPDLYSPTYLELLENLEYFANCTEEQQVAFMESSSFSWTEEEPQTATSELQSLRWGGETSDFANNKVIGLADSLKAIEKHAEMKSEESAELGQLGQVLRQSIRVGNLNMLEPTPPRFGSTNSSVGSLNDGDPDSFAIDLEAPLEELSQLVREANQLDQYGTFSVFLLGLILAWVLGSRLVKPVTEVVEGMQKVASGDTKVRLPRQSDDADFSLINGQFNEMVQQLENARSLERGLEHRERLQTMGDLAAGVAHDIRNPLSAISMIVGRLGHDYAPTEAREREEFLTHTKDIKDEIERLNKLVSDFLQLAQPNSKEAIPSQVGGLLEELQRLLDKEASDQNVSITLEIQDDLAETRWNPIEGKSAFLNVAMNAIQVMPETGGSLTIQARSDDHWIVVAFKDNGPGIPREDCDQVMLPYVTRRPGGTGLGLAIARRVAERYGGRLELTSQVGVGTEVRFMLPVRTQEGRA